MSIPDLTFWQDKTTGLYYADSLEDILYRADLLAAKYIDLGLAFFRGQISIDDFAEEIGSRSYDAGFAAYWFTNFGGKFKIAPKGNLWFLQKSITYFCTAIYRII